MDLRALILSPVEWLAHEYFAAGAPSCSFPTPTIITRYHVKLCLLFFLCPSARRDHSELLSWLPASDQALDAQAA